MKQILQILSSLIIIGSSSSVVVANSQITSSTPKTNANLISINSQENLEGQDPILSDLSKGGRHCWSWGITSWNWQIF